MVADKPEHDTLTKLYAEWISAAVKMSISGFAATAKMMDAASQAVVAVKQRTAAAPTPSQGQTTKTPDSTKLVPTPKIVVSADAPGRAVQVDDLKLITGVGPKLAQMLSRKGINSFSKLALLDDAAIDRLESDLNLNGRIRRDNWLGQAAKLAGG